MKDIKQYVIYDSRYLSDEDAATVFEVCETLKEARENKGEYGEGNVIVEETLKHIKGTEFKIVSSTIIN